MFDEAVGVLLWIKISYHLLLQNLVVRLSLEFLVQLVEDVLLTIPLYQVHENAVVLFHHEGAPVSLYQSYLESDDLSCLCYLLLLQKVVQALVDASHVTNTSALSEPTQVPLDMRPDQSCFASDLGVPSFDPELAYEFHEESKLVAKKLFVLIEVQSLLILHVNFVEERVHYGELPPVTLDVLSACVSELSLASMFSI